MRKPKLEKMLMKHGDIYCVTTGDFAGQIFVFIRKDKQRYGFLSVPKMENVWVSEEKLDIGFEHGILDRLKNEGDDDTEGKDAIRIVAKAKFEENERLL